MLSRKKINGFVNTGERNGGKALMSRKNKFISEISAFFENLLV
jgi:hypothetical protein